MTMHTLALTLAMLGPTEWVIIAGVILLLFGARKLPQLARSMGSSITQFKKGLSDSETPELDEPKDGPKQGGAPPDAGRSGSGDGGAGSA